MQSSEFPPNEDVDSRTLFRILVIAAVTARIAITYIPEWPIVYYHVDKGIVSGCMYVMVPNEGKTRSKVPCENFTPAQLTRMGGYAQK